MTRAEQTRIKLEVAALLSKRFAAKDSRVEADDLFQEACLAAVKADGRYDESKGDYRGYVFGVISRYLGGRIMELATQFSGGGHSRRRERASQKTVSMETRLGLTSEDPSYTQQNYLDMAALSATLCHGVYIQELIDPEQHIQRQDLRRRLGAYLGSVLTSDEQALAFEVIIGDSDYADLEEQGLPRTRAQAITSAVRRFLRSDRGLASMLKESRPGPANARSRAKSTAKALAPAKAKASPQKGNANAESGEPQSDRRRSRDTAHVRVAGRTSSDDRSQEPEIGSPRDLGLGLHQRSRGLLPQEREAEIPSWVQGRGAFGITWVHERATGADVAGPNHWKAFGDQEDRSPRRIVICIHGPQTDSGCSPEEPSSENGGGDPPAITQVLTTNRGDLDAGTSLIFHGDHPMLSPKSVAAITSVLKKWKQTNNEDLIFCQDLGQGQVELSLFNRYQLLRIKGPGVIGNGQSKITISRKEALNVLEQRGPALTTLTPLLSGTDGCAPITSKITHKLPAGWRPLGDGVRFHSISLFEAMAFCCLIDVNREEHPICWALVFAKNGDLVTSDQRRLHVVQLGKALDKTQNIAIDRDLIEILMATLRKVGPRTVSIIHDQESVAVRVVSENLTIEVCETLQTLDLPPYGQIIDTPRPISIAINTADFRHHMLAICKAKEMKDAKLVLQSDQTSLRIRAMSVKTHPDTEQGLYSQRMGLRLQQHPPETGTIQCPPHQALDAVLDFGPETIIEYGSDREALVFRNATDSRQIAIIAPIPTEI